MNYSTVEQEIAGFKRDAQRDQTGNYLLLKGTGNPIQTHVIEPIPRRKPPPSIKKYGLTRFTYWALQDKQNHRCAVCGDLPSGKYALHVDHCHETNKVRGLLCHNCNIAIGMMRDDPQTARAIADYLESHYAARV